MKWDAVIVGSGFGGAMTAHRLVEAGARVLMIERGSWVPRGEAAWLPEASLELTPSYAKDIPYRCDRGGHGTTIAGVMVDGGTFDFGAQPERFPGFNQPDPSYNGLKYWEALGHGAYAAKLRVQLLRDTGAAIAPLNSFLILQGIETLSLRMERHVTNTQALAEWLESRDEVETVHYAGLPSSPYHQQAQKYMPKGAGAVVSFELHGGVDAGRAFVDGTELFSQLVNIGDVRSLIVHPASTTHSQLSPEELASAGASPGLVRLAVGLENLDDLKNDLELGFRAAKAHQ